MHTTASLKTYGVIRADRRDLVIFMPGFGDCGILSAPLIKLAVDRDRLFRPPARPICNHHRNQPNGIHLTPLNRNGGGLSAQAG